MIAGLMKLDDFMPTSSENKKEVVFQAVLEKPNMWIAFYFVLLTTRWL